MAHMNSVWSNLVGFCAKVKVRKKKTFDEKHYKTVLNENLIDEQLP